MKNGTGQEMNHNITQQKSKLEGLHKLETTMYVKITVPGILVMPLKVLPLLFRIRAQMFIRIRLAYTVQGDKQEHITKKTTAMLSLNMMLWPRPLEETLIFTFCSPCHAVTSYRYSVN